MATTIDNKTVQMNFDNSNFERNISQSMNSLKQMDGQLQSMEKTKSLETLNNQAKQVDFSHMSKGLDNVKVHFSALQVAGMTVISELTKKVMHFGSSLLKNTFGQIKSGGIKRALNLEQAEFQVTGLAKNVMKTDKRFKEKADVWKALLKDVDYAVDGTAYGLDEASKVASQLMASNVKIGNDMKTSLRGISGMAAMTGRTYSDIGNIFTKVAGNGRLMSQELLQFSASGLNAAATLTDYLNKHKSVRESIIKTGLQSKKGAKDVKQFAKSTKLTEQNLRTLVTAGAIDFKTFSKAMDEAFGEHATKANETYEGSLMNVKAALSRVGEPIATNTFENLRKIFNTLIPIINGVKKELIPLMDYIQELEDIVGKFVRDTLKGLELSYEKVKVNGKTKEVVSGVKTIHEAVKSFTEYFKKTVNIVAESVKSFKPAIDSVKNIFIQLKDILAKVFSGTVEDKLNTLGKGITYLGNIVSKLFGILELVVKILKPVIIPAIKVIVGLLYGAASALKMLVDNIHQFLSTNEAFLTGIAEKIVTVFNTLKPLFMSLWNLGTAVFDAIGNALNTLFESFKNSKSKGFDTFVDGLKGIVNVISSVINKIAELIRKTQFVQAIGLLLGNIIKGIGYVLTHLGTVIGKLLKGISNLFNKIKEGIRLGDTLKNIMDTVKKGISDIIGMLNQNGDTVIRTSVFALLAVKIKQLIWAFRDLQGKGLLKYARPVQNILTNLGTTIFKFNQQIRYKTLKEIAVSILLLSVALMILAGIPQDKLNTAITAITSLFIELSASFKSISKAGSFKLGPVARTLISLAVSVLILSSALKKVSSIDEKNLYKSIGAISILIAEMIGTIKILSSGNKKLSGGVTTILSLAIAVKMLSKSVISLAKLSWDELKRGLISVGLILGGIVAYLTLSSLVNDKIGKSSVKSALSIILVAKAIKTLSKVIQTIGNMSWEEIIKGLTTIGILLVAITGYIAITALIGDKIGKSSVKSAASILIIATALKMLSKVVKTLGSMSWAEIGKGLAVVGSMMVSLVVFSLALNKVGKMSLKSAAGILLVAVAIKLLAGTVAMLGNIAPEKLVNGLMVFISMLMSLAIALNAMKGTLGGSASLVVASTAILILAGSLKLISTIPIVGLAGSLVTLALTLLIFSKAASAMSGSIPALMGVAGAITVLGVGMALLGVGILALALGLKMVIEVIVRLGTGLKDIVVALVMAVVESIKGIVKGIADMMPDLIKVVSVLLKGVLKIIRDIVPELGKTIAEVLVSVLDSIASNIEPIIQSLIDIIIGIFNGLASRVGDLTDAIGNFLGAIGDQIVKVLGNVSTEKVIKLLLAVTFISIIIKVLSTMQTQAAKAIITVGLIAISLLILTGVFALIGMVDNSITEKLKSISIFLAVMTLVLIGCALIGSLAAPAIIGLGILIAAIAVITLVMVALGALADKIEPFIDKGGPLLIKLGSYIGQFLGAFIGGIAMQAVQALPALGDALGQFGQKIGPFTKAIQEMPLDIIVKIGALVAAVLAITASSFMNKIMTFLSFGEDPIDSFINMMIKLGNGLKKFNATIAGVDASGAETASNVLLKLSQTASLIPSSGGWLQKFTGNKDLDGFGTGVKSLATGLKTFVSSIDTSIDVAKYEPYVNLIKKMAEIADLVPRSGGWLQNLVGNKDLAGFGNAIKPLAEGIKAFADKAVEIEDPEALNNIIGIIKKMVEVQDKLPKSGGLWQAIAGSKDWDSLSEGLTSMVDCFKEISKSLSGKEVNLEVIQTAVKLLQDIAKVNTAAIEINEKDTQKKKSGDSEGFVSKIIDPIKKAVAKIKEYQKTLKQEDMDGMISYFDVLKNFVNKLGSAFSDKETQKNLEIVKTLGDSIASLLEAVSKVKELMSSNNKGDKKDTGDVDTSLQDKLTKFAQAIIDFSNKMAGEYNNLGILNAKEAVDYLKSMSDLKIDKFDNAKNSVENLQSMLKSFKDLNKSENKLSTGKGSQIESLKTYVTEVKTALKDMATSLKSDGGIKKQLKELSSFGTQAKKFSEGLKAVADAFKAITNTGVTADKGTAVQQAMSNAAKTGVNKFYEGLKGKKDKVKTAFKELLKLAKSVGKEVFTSGSFINLGHNLIDGIIQGINNRTDGLKKAMSFQITAAFKVTKKKAKINSPSKLWAEIGKGLMEGEALGIKTNAHLVKDALVDSVDQAAKITDGALKDSATPIAGKFVKRLNNATKDSMKKSSYKTGGALKSLFMYFYDTNKLDGSVPKIVGAAQKNLKKAAKILYETTNPEQAEEEKAKRKDAQKRIDKNKKIVEKFTKKKGKYHKIYKKWQSKTGQKKTKYYNSHKKTLKKYVSAKKKLSKARKDKKDINKTIRDNITSTWQELGKTIKDNARTFMDPLAQAIDYGLNMFEKFEKGQRISAGRMLANYASNVKGIEKYNAALEELKKRVSPEMYEEIKSKGISAMNQIEAINRMSPQQLNDLQIYETTNNRLRFENMLTTLKERLASGKRWKEKIVELTKRGLNKDALQEILNMGIAEAGPYIDALLTADTNEIKEFNKQFALAREEETEMAKAGQASYAKSATGGINEASNKKAGKKAALNYGAGILAGLKDKKKNKQISEAAYNLADKIVQSVNKRLGIHSPAKEGARSGMYTVLGLVQGIASNINLAQNAGEELAESVLDPLQTLENAEDTIEENPTITPVLDLNRLEKDIKILDNMLNNNSYTVAMTADIAKNGRRGFIQNTQRGDIINNYNNNFTQNNYSPEALDEVTIYRETKNYINSKMEGGLATS